MTDRSGNEFDLKFRSILEDAREEVPEHIWEDIERRLPAAPSPASRKVILPFWAKLAGGISAAAAVAIALFLTGTRPSLPENELLTSTAPQVMLADAGKPLETPVLAEEEQAITGETPVIPEEIMVIPEEETVIAEATTVFPEEETVFPEEVQTVYQEETAIAAAVPAQEEVKEDRPEEGTAGREMEDEAAAWEQLLREESQDLADRKVRTAITLSGNALSNTNPASADNRLMQAYRPGENEIRRNYISESSESTYAAPVSFGVGAKIIFTPRWSLGVGVNYSLLSRKFAGNYYQTDGTDGFSETYFSNIRNRQDYIGIPINVYFNILSGKFIDFYAYAGGTGEKCVSNRYLMQAGSGNLTHSEKVRGMQFSADLGIGLEFIIARRFGIYVDPSLRYYFKNAHQPKSIRTSQPLMFGLELGFRVRL